MTKLRFPLKLPNKIVLFGVSRSGKSTLGDQFRARLGHLQLAFADPLKHVCKEIFGFSDHDLWGPSHTRETRYKHFLFSGWCFECNQQCLGPERRLPPNPIPSAVLAIQETHIDDDDYWCCTQCGAQYSRYVTPREALKTLGTNWGRRFVGNLWAQSCFLKMQPDLSYVVTDGRFENERWLSHHYGACTVLLLRALDDSNSPHPSEKDIREMSRYPALFHVTLDNREGTPLQNFNKLLEQFNALGLRTTWDNPELSRIQWRHYDDRFLELL